VILRFLTSNAQSWAEWHDNRELNTLKRFITSLPEAISVRRLFATIGIG
jgi:hypothetical protein